MRLQGGLCLTSHLWMELGRVIPGTLKYLINLFGYRSSCLHYFLLGDSPPAARYLKGKDKPTIPMCKSVTVWPLHFYLPVTGQKPFCLCIYEYCINGMLCGSWLHPFWVEDETWQLLVIRGASVRSYLPLNIHPMNNWTCLYIGLYF